MNVHEYQGKEILRKYGVATPRGIPCFSVTEAEDASRELGGKAWVVKAQIHAGGRGKGGGVKLARSTDEVREHASRILGMTLVTHQTGPEGRLVKRLLVEEGADICKELYVGMVVDRATQRVTLMASSEGGMDIEEVAASTPDKIYKVAIDPKAGLTDAQADDVARKIGVPEPSLPEARKFTRRIPPKSKLPSSIFRTFRSMATSAVSSTARGSRWRPWTPSNSTVLSPRTSSMWEVGPPPKK